MEALSRCSKASSSLQRQKGWSRRLNKPRLLKDVSAHHQRVQSVTSKDTRGLNVDSDRLAIYKIIYYHLMLLWSYRVESRVGFSGVGRGLVEHFMPDNYHSKLGYPCPCTQCTPSVSARDRDFVPTSHPPTTQRHDDYGRSPCRARCS